MVEGAPNYEEHEMEIESIKCIFMDDLVMLEEKPYRFEVLLNANNELSRNHLQLKLTFELPDEYPNVVPSIRIKNLSPDIINNNIILEFDKLVTKKAEESIGTMMLYEVCEALREKIGEMNDIILRKLDEINKKDSLETALKSVAVRSDAPLTFTPVTQETFAKWCDAYKERMRKLKEELLSEKDLKETGRQIFESKKLTIDDLKIEDQDDEEFREEGAEDDDFDELEEGQAFYDKALYEEGLDEDVDFE